MEGRFALVALPVGLRPPYVGNSANGAPSIELPLLDKGALLHADKGSGCTPTGCCVV